MTNDKHPTPWKARTAGPEFPTFMEDANGNLVLLNATNLTRIVAAVNAMETMLNPKSDLPEIEGRLSFLERVIGEYEKAVNDATD